MQKNFVVSFFYCIFVVGKENNSKKYKVMKAIKLYNIKWNTKDVPAEDVKKLNLPEYKGFTVNDDDYDVVENVPNLLKKKFKYDIIDFSFIEIPIIEDFINLMYFCVDKKEKSKNLFKVNGELSAVGMECVDALKHFIHNRVRLESKNTPAYEMPKNLDIVMLALERITGKTWEVGCTAEEWIEEVDKLVKKVVEEKSSYMKSRKKAIKAKKEEDNGDSDFDYNDDDEFVEED